MNNADENVGSGNAHIVARGLGGTPQDRMVRSAAALIARDGLAATRMREVADHAKAPRGSIGHHFPGGKHQLTLEALTWIGSTVHSELERIEPAGKRKHPHGVEVLRKFVAMWRAGLSQNQVSSGCSVAAVVHDSGDPELLARAAYVFASWRKPFYNALLTEGIDRERAASLATTVIAALEGAVILSRAEKDIAPLEQTAVVLQDLLIHG